MEELFKDHQARPTARSEGDQKRPRRVQESGLDGALKQVAGRADEVKELFRTKAFGVVLSTLKKPGSGGDRGWQGSTGL